MRRVVAEGTIILYFYVYIDASSICNTMNVSPYYQWSCQLNCLFCIFSMQNYAFITCSFIFSMLVSVCFNIKKIYSNTVAMSVLPYFFLPLPSFEAASGKLISENAVFIPFKKKQVTIVSKNSCMMI